MRTFRPPTCAALVQCRDILQSLSRHLPMALLHVTGLLFRNCLQYAVPYVLQ